MRFALSALHVSGISPSGERSRCGLGDIAKSRQFEVCWKIASHVRDNAIGIISRQCGLFEFPPAEISHCGARDGATGFRSVSANWEQQLFADKNTLARGQTSNSRCKRCKMCFDELESARVMNVIDIYASSLPPILSHANVEKCERNGRMVRHVRKLCRYWFHRYGAAFRCRDTVNYANLKQTIFHAGS